MKKYRVHRYPHENTVKFISNVPLDAVLDAATDSLFNTTISENYVIVHLGEFYDSEVESFIEQIDKVMTEEGYTKLGDNSQEQTYYDNLLKQKQVLANSKYGLPVPDNCLVLDFETANDKNVFLGSVMAYAIEHELKFNEALLQLVNRGG